jgi:hypothetical protein
MRALFVAVMVLSACELEPGPMAPPPDAEADAGLVLDASVPPAMDAGLIDAGGVDAGTPPPDAGRFDAGPLPTTGDGGLAGPRLVVGLGTGQVVAWPLRPSDLAVGDAVVLELGAAVQAVARRPGTNQYLVAVDGSGTANATLRLVRLDENGWQLGSSGSAGTQDVSFLTFDATGTWALFSGGGAFRALQVNADGTLGAARSVSSCDAQMLIQQGAGFLGACRFDNRIMRFDFSVGAGLTMPRAQVSLPSTFNPVGFVSFGAVMGVHGAKQNGASGSENRVGLFGPTASSLTSSVVLKPPNTEMSAVYATVSAKHPTLPVGYFVNGGSVAYGGNNLGVVGLASSGGLEVRQYVMLPWANSYNSGSVAVTPDGRWVLVGTNVVSEVRAWPIDQVTGQLGTSRVVVLSDLPVFIEVSSP